EGDPGARSAQLLDQFGAHDGDHVTSALAHHAEEGILQLVAGRHRLHAHTRVDEGGNEVGALHAVELDGAPGRLRYDPAHALQVLERRCCPPRVGDLEVHG